MEKEQSGCMKYSSKDSVNSNAQNLNTNMTLTQNVKNNILEDVMQPYCNISCGCHLHNHVGAALTHANM